jgi:hypothetical protein
MTEFCLRPLISEYNFAPPLMAAPGAHQERPSLNILLRLLFKWIADRFEGE